jgi:hypothetical protein
VFACLAQCRQATRRALEIGGHHPCERFDPRPRGPVRHEPAPYHRPLVHRDRHHSAAAGGEHAGNDGTGDEERSQHLRFDDLAKAARRDFPERLRLGEEARIHRAHANAGVTDEKIHAAEPLVGVGDPRPHRVLVADVELDAHRAAAELLGGGLGPGALPAGHDDLGAGGDERGGHRPPEPACGSGDDRTCPGEVGHLDSVEPPRRGRPTHAQVGASASARSPSTAIP